MHCFVSARVWIILALVLSSGWGDPSAEAQLFRGRRQQKCCCPAPCNPCYCEARDEARRCVISLLYSSENYWLYYAHHHENGTECDFYNECFHPSSAALSPVPMSCLDEQCFDPTRSYTNTTPAPGLFAPIGAGDDLSTLMAGSTATKLDEVAGNITLPVRGKIHARIGVFKVKAPVVVDGVKKDVIEYFGFGFESADTGRDEFDARKVKEHKIGSTPQKNLYEFKIGSLKCVVLTTNAGP